MQKYKKFVAGVVMLGVLVLGLVSYITAASINVTNGGFESNFTGWNAGSNWTADSSSKHGGDKSARVKGSTNSSSILSQSPVAGTGTLGFNNPTISFWYNADSSLDEDDYVKAEYTLNGSTWVTFYTINDSNDNGSWHQVSYNSFPSGASNNANFGIRFRANLNSASSDRVNIDDVSLSATEIINRTLTVNTVGDGGVTSAVAGINCGSDCTESYVDGSTVTLTAGPATGSEFTGWSGACSGTGACTLTMNSAKNVTANFSPITTTINAKKIVCSNESDLPNWGNGGANITASTAADYVSSHPNCHFASGFSFEWALYSASNPGDNVLTGGSGWTAFGPTDSNGLATATVLGQEPLWVREQVKTGYVPFSGATTNLDGETEKYSAELYCENDVLNYDNFDYIEMPNTSKTVNCVAFNVLEKTEDTTAPTVVFDGFRNQDNDTYDSLKSLQTCGATNESGYIAWEWHLGSEPEPVTYNYKITSGPTAVGFTVNKGGDTHHNGGIPMEGTYTVEVTATDANGNVSSPASCSVTYKKPQPICLDKTMDIVSNEKDIAAPGSTQILAYIHSAWSQITGANWIWNVNGVNDPLIDETASFTKSFDIPGKIISASLSVLADNEYTGNLNAFSFTGSVSGDTTFGNDFNNLHTYDVKDHVVTGNNNISFNVKNWAQEGGNAESNPAGLNYKLQVVYNDCKVVEEPVNTAPTVTLIGDSSITITLPGTYTELGATGNDAEDGVLVPVINSNVISGTPGTYTVTYTVTDSKGYSAMVTRTVIVNPAPEIITEEPVDVCKNIEGNQSEVPSGKHLEGDSCVDNQTETTGNGGGSTTGGTTGGGGVVPIAFLGGGGSAPQGRVLGASTSCGIYLDKFLRKGYKNDEESVKKLQKFLNDYYKLNIPNNGVFGPMTDSAVKKFQLEFAGDILTPWKLKSPTGIVYLTTTTKINKIMCPDLDLTIPNLIPIDQNPNAPKL